MCTLMYCWPTGKLTVREEIGFLLLSEPIAEDPQFNLTCISTGGPPTTVTWTRDSVTVTDGIETVLDNSVTAQYTHTLTVTGRLPGLYTCTVANSIPSTDSTTTMFSGMCEKSKGLLL